MSFFKKLFSKEKEEELDKGLEKTKTSFFGKIGRAIAGKSTVDEEVLDELEQVLISSDVGLDTTIKNHRTHRSKGSQRQVYQYRRTKQDPT